MRKETSILYVSYPLLPVSDESCGGAEQMLSTLESEMARRGYRTASGGMRGIAGGGRIVVYGSGSVGDGFGSKNAMRNTGGQCWISCDEGGIPGWIWYTTRAAASGSRLAQINLPVLATLHLPRHFYPAECVRKCSAEFVLQLRFGGAEPEFCRSGQYGWRGKERGRGVTISRS